MSDNRGGPQPIYYLSKAAMMTSNVRKAIMDDGPPVARSNSPTLQHLENKVCELGFANQCYKIDTSFRAKSEHTWCN